MVLTLDLARSSLSVKYNLLADRRLRKDAGAIRAKYRLNQRRRTEGEILSFLEKDCPKDVTLAAGAALDNCGG